jgi:hypothetical protein
MPYVLTLFDIGLLEQCEIISAIMHEFLEMKHMSRKKKSPEVRYQSKQGYRAWIIDIQSLVAQYEQPGRPARPHMVIFDVCQDRLKSVKIGQNAFCESDLISLK